VEGGRSQDADRGAYLGWIIGLAIVAAVMAVGAWLWFSHHP
jgi:hypothetical protein